MYYFIVNEYGKSGQGRKVWQEIRKLLIEKEIDFKAYSTEKVNDAGRFAKAITEKENESTIIIVGGDGTINEVVNGIVDFETAKIGVIPLGSANDFAKSVGIAENPIEAIESILNCKEEKRLDLGCVHVPDREDRLFAISSGLGFDAEVCKNLMTSTIKSNMNKVGLGGKSYVATTLKTILTCDRYKIEVSYDGGETVEYDDCVFIAAMNAPMEGGGVKMAPNALMEDGYLTSSCGHGARGIKIFPALVKLLNAKHEGIKEFDIRNFKTMSVKAERPMCFHTDGEVLEDASEVEFECLPGKMRFLM